MKLVDYTYEPYGKASADAGSTNALQFTGRENDGTGLNYFRARYQSPVLGRFVSEDPIGLAGGLNVYAYATNNPINLTDALGLYVTMTCRPVSGFSRLEALGMRGPVHCAVFVWHYGYCGGKVIDAQYSLPGGATTPTRNPTNGTYGNDRAAFGNGAGNYAVPPPSGMSQNGWDSAVRNSGDHYSQGPYIPVPGPNSNTAATNIITNAGGVAPDVPDAWGQGYQPYTGGFYLIGD